MQGFIARRLLRNVTVAELLRRAFSTAARLAPAGLLVVLMLWLPALALPVALVPLLPVLDVEAAALLTQFVIAGWTMLVTPLAAALVARAAIRSAGGGRLPVGQVFTGFGSALYYALLPALVTGVLTIFGFGLLIIPGFVIGAMLFVVGPVAAIERRSFGASVRRSFELTRGSRFAFFGVVFVIGFVESTLLVIAAFFAGLGDALTAALVWFAITLCGALWRATAAALAYADLRTTQENLEVDALANELGGAPKKADVALSDDDIEGLAKRRKVVGLLTGQSLDGGMSIDGVASVREMEAFATRRDRRRRVGIIAAASVVVTVTVVAGALGLYSRLRENRELAAFEADIRTADASLDTDPASETFEPLRRDQVSRQVLEHLVTVRPERRLEMLGRLMSIHSDHFYGPGFSAAFAALGRGEDSDALLGALASQIESNGCDRALTAAKENSENRGKAFAEACPPPSAFSSLIGVRSDTSTISPRRFRKGLPLGRAAFAQLLELRARGRQVDSHSLHEATLKLLLGA